MAEWYVAYRENWQLNRISGHAWLVGALFAALAITALVLTVEAF
jgi:hypothetical protein